MTDMVLTTACGKVILLGEHAVVYGVPALCAALEHGATVEARPGDGRLRIPAWQLVSEPAGALLAKPVQNDWTPPVLAYRAILRSLDVGCSPAMRHDFVASFAIPTGAGLGSSAALSVALIRCLDHALSLGLKPTQVDAAAWAAEQIFHGQPSGLDHTVAQYGGLGLFQRGRGLSPLSGLAPVACALSLIVGHTGRARDTRGRVERVAELYRQDPHTTQGRFDRIAALVDQAVSSLRSGDLSALGAAMNQNQTELSALEVSCVEIEELCALARQAGALGAKLTGGGGGGCVVALAPGNEAEVATAWRQAGYSSFVVRICAK